MTTLLYFDDSYMSEFSALVDEVLPEGVVLDRTAFYPMGRGQSCDTGILQSSSRTNSA